MISFKQWLESKLYRIDNEKIKDFSKDLKTYYRNKDWSTSGTFDDESKVPPDWVKEKGLFAGDRKSIIPYATPRNTKWIVTYDDPKRPTVYFNQADMPNINKHRPTLSAFDDTSFQKVPSGEYFSKTPNQPMSQEIVRNPLRFIKQWYNVKFVPDIEQLANDLRNRNIRFDGEGI